MFFLLAQNLDGEIKATDEGLQVNGAKEIHLKLAAETSYFHRDFEKTAEDNLDEIAFSSWGLLQQAHLREYKSWYDRMSLSLGKPATDDTPTDQRIQNIKAGQTALHLGKLLFDFGHDLFDAHPPYQIDGNFGYTEGIAEMPLQSHEEGIIRILPAIPNAWQSGSVKGLKARGGFTLDFTWESGEVKTIRLHSSNGR